jgi:hypothetical protein
MEKSKIDIENAHAKKDFNFLKPIKIAQYAYITLKMYDRI